jgi:hypothetical protein
MLFCIAKDFKVKKHLTESKTSNIQIIIEPIVTHASETLVLTKKDEALISTWGRKSRKENFWASKRKKYVEDKK